MKLINCCLFIPLVDSSSEVKVQVTCVVSSHSFDLPEGESVESGVEYFVSIIHKFAKGQPCPTSSALSY